MTVVSNSFRLISLAKIESFHLLQQLYGTLTISEEFYAEVVVLGAGLPEASETSSSSWIQVKYLKRPSEVTAAQERFGLGFGEISTLILAKEVGAELVILDDLGVDLRGVYTELLKRGVCLNRDLLNRILESLDLAPI